MTGGETLRRQPAGFRGIFRDDADALAVYSEAAGIQRIMPLAVAVPADADDLVTLVRWAAERGVALIPRGSGSSMSGGAIGDGVIVDLSRWTTIDLSGLAAGAADTARVIVGPGVICGDLGRVLAERGLRMPVSPSSAGFCTIGGMTATNAAGAHSLAQGAMREWVTGVECVFADGSRSWVRRGRSPSGVPASVAALNTAALNGATQDTSALNGATQNTAAPSVVALSAATREAAPVDRSNSSAVRKNSSGYAVDRFSESGDLVDLLVGSEGTLAFFTAIELRVVPLPAAASSVMGIFASLEAATRAAIGAREAGADACELLDRTFLEIAGAATNHPLADDTEAILLADVEGESDGAADTGAMKVAEAFAAAGATATQVATTAADRERLWELRHAASPILSRMSERYRSMQFIEDGAVPPDRLGEYVAGVRSALEGQSIRGVIFGHAGDGHVHVNPLVDVTTGDWRTRVEALLDEVTALVSSLGGTLAGEHGDGRLRTPLLDRVWDADHLAAFARIKLAFDPQGILNPGVKTGPVVALGDIKYDPTLAPLPDSALRVLREVESGRRYGEFRLSALGRLADPVSDG